MLLGGTFKTFPRLRPRDSTESLLGVNLLFTGVAGREKPPMREERILNSQSVVLKEVVAPQPGDPTNMRAVRPTSPKDRH